MVPHENTVHVRDHHHESSQQGGEHQGQTQQAPDQPPGDGEDAAVVEHGHGDQHNGQRLVP